MLTCCADAMPVDYAWFSAQKVGYMMCVVCVVCVVCMCMCVCGCGVCVLCRCKYVYVCMCVWQKACTLVHAVST